MTHYDRIKRKRLGDVLVDEGLATEETVISALQEQQRAGGLLTDILLEMRQVNEQEVALAIVEHYQVPYVDLKNYTIHKDLIQEFPAALLHRARVVPLDRYGKQMCVACQEIPGKDVVDELKKRAPGGVYFFIASALEVRRVLADYVGTAKPAEKGQAAPAPTKGDVESSAWKNLFDAANESILTELRTGDE
jgi:type IV pilus assembly protein PilB